VLLLLLMLLLLLLSLLKSSRHGQSQNAALVDTSTNSPPKQNLKQQKNDRIART
jgi:hypothetical protein